MQDPNGSGQFGHTQQVHFELGVEVLVIDSADHELLNLLLSLGVFEYLAVVVGASCNPITQLGYSGLGLGGSVTHDVGIKYK